MLGGPPMSLVPKIRPLTPEVKLEIGGGKLEFTSPEVFSEVPAWRSADWSGRAPV